jgi:type IV pilus assembly protein PilZ
MPQDSDRRQDNRGAIELRVEYRRLNTFFYDYTKNISRGGTFIRTSRPLDIGTRFVFKLVVPTLDAPLELRGEVRWIRREGELPAAGSDPADRDPGMGIRFIFEADSERLEVERRVEKMMIASLGERIYAQLRAGTGDA